MNPLQAALRDKYGTPEKALEALGLPKDLLGADGAPLTTARRTTMKKPMLNSTALRVHAALVGLLGPKLAADAAMPDLRPVVAGVTRANLGKTKAEIWAKAKVAMKPVLAADQAGPDDVALRLLEMIDGGAGGAAEMEAQPVTAEAEQTVDAGAEPGAPVADPAATAEPVQTEANSAVPPVKPKKPGEGEEPEGEAAAIKALAEKLGGDMELAKSCYDICMGGAKDEVADPAATEIPSGGKAVDKRKAKDEVPMMKPAMDAAISTAVTQVKADMRAEMRAAQEARQVVRPWVGEVGIAFDTAQEVFKAALESLGVKTKDVHPSAYRTILENVPKPGSRRQLAMDGVTRQGKGQQGSDVARRFPHAARIQVLG